MINEEGYDRMRDDRLVKYGIGHDGSDRKSTPSRSSGKKTKGKTVYQKQAEKEHGKGVTALDIVKKNIEKKHGKGAIMSTKKEGYSPLKSFKQVVSEEPVTAAVVATKAAIVGAKAAKGAAVAAKAGAAAGKAGAAGAKAGAGAAKAGGAAAKQASVAGTTAGSSSKTAGFGQKLGDAAKEGAKDAAVDHVRDKVRKAAGPKEEDTNEETLHEISADTALAASKEADKKRGKLAAAGDKEGAKKKNAQAVRLYKASAAKRKTETKEEYTVTNADKKGNTPAWKAYKSGKKHAKTGKPLYKAADHVKEGHWEYHEPEGLKKFSDFIQEGNPTTRMMQKSKTQQTGNISADRGTDAKKNRESRKGLEKDLKKKGIGYKKGTGEYKYDDGSKGREVSYQTSPGKGMSKRRFGKVMRRLGRKHGQESVITKDKGKPARLHDTESKKPGKSVNIGKTKAGKHPEGAGETSGTKVRSGKLSKKTNKPSYHYG